MKLEIDMPEHHYNNIIAFDSVSLGRVPYKGIIMYAINAIKRGKALEQEPTTKNDLGVDCISRFEVTEILNSEYDIDKMLDRVDELPSVTPQEPRCKDCKWWKDSDGEYRRGCGAESKCPINTKTVYLGKGYCYKFEPQESEDKK